MATTEDDSSDWDEPVKTTEIRRVVDDGSALSPTIVGGSEPAVVAEHKANTDDNAGENPQYAVTEEYAGRYDIRTDRGSSVAEAAMPTSEPEAAAVVSGTSIAIDSIINSSGSSKVSPVVVNRRVTDQMLVSIASSAHIPRATTDVPREGHRSCGGLHRGTNVAMEGRSGATTAAAAVREQRSIRQDILDLTREDGRETVSVLSKAHVVVDAELRQDGSCQGTAVSKEGGGGGEEACGELLAGDERNYSQRRATTCRHKDERRRRLSPANNSARNKDDTLLQDTVISLSPSRTRSRPISPQRLTKIIDTIHRVELADQAVTSLCLAEAVESILGTPSSHTCAHDEHQQHVQFWSLVIRGCQLPSLLPVAGLLHYLDGLCVLEIDGCAAGIALNGLERVLEDSPCLHTLILRRCGISQCSRLQSGSIEVLDISDNRIKDAAGLETLFRLKRLNMAGNCVRSLMDLRPLVPLGTGSMRELNLAGNPVQDVPRYRAGVMAMIPSLRLLDGATINLPWRARVAAEKRTIIASYEAATITNEVASCKKRPASTREGDRRGRGACRTALRVRDRSVDGYCSDGKVWRRGVRGVGQEERMTGRVGAPNHPVSSDNGGYVRGLAGLGLIWGGAPRGQSSPRRGSSSAPTSPVKSRTAWDITRFSRTNTLDGASLCGGLGRLGAASVGSRHKRPPSPERCRQIEGDTTRSRPRCDWDTRFRHHQQQELLARSRQQARQAVVSKRRQTASMERLAQPPRVLREHQQDQQQQGDNRWYRTIGDGTSAYMTSAEANASQLWNASFSDAILGESVGLINRPTALKGADGKWEGVVATPTAATERRIPRTAMRDIHPHGAAELQRSTSSLPHTPPKSSAMDNEISEECAAATVAKSQNLDEQQQQQQPRMAIQRDPNACGAVIPPATVTSGSPRMQSPACRAAAREIPTPPSTPPRAPVQCPSNTPARATLMLPDEWALRPASIRTSSGSEHQVHHAVSNAYCTRTPRTPPSSSRGGKGAPELPFGGQGRRGGNVPSSTWSSVTGRRSEEGSSVERMGRGKREGGSSPPRRPARGFRVMKTSRDFAETVQRVFKVDLREEEAKSLYQQLDVDRDGALGAEDLLRGAPTLANFLTNRKPSKQEMPRWRRDVPRRDVSRRDVSRRDAPGVVSAERALNRSAARSRQSQIRAHERRRKAQHSTGGTSSDRDYDQRRHEDFDQEFDALRGSGPVYREGRGNEPVSRERPYLNRGDGRRCHTPSSSEEDPVRSGGEAVGTMEDVPRCLEDWRVPDISPRPSSWSMNEIGLPLGRD